MEEMDSKKSYKAPKAKVVEVGIRSVLCGSQDGLDSDGGASTEKLDEQDYSGLIWG